MPTVRFSTMRLKTGIIRFSFSRYHPLQNRCQAVLLAEAIDRDFGSFDAFKEQFTSAAAALFGSGWTWLVKDRDGKLSIRPMPNAGNPLRDGLTPLLTVDVWEHAYYIDYRNRRAEFLKNFWDLIDWKTVEERFAK